MVTKEFIRIAQALGDNDPKELAKVYIYALSTLVELEREYNLAKIQRLDFGSRTALEKQEIKLLQEDERLRYINDQIAYFKAVLRACTFVLDVLKLQNAKTFSQDEVEEENHRKPERIERPKDVPHEPTKTILSDR